MIDKGERVETVVTADNLSQLTMSALKEHLFKDWDQRWKQKSYKVIYRIGGAEE
jgi:hypothetical protein